MSWRNSGQVSVFFLLPRAGAVLNVVQSAAEHSVAVYWGQRVGLAGVMAVRIAGCDPIITVDPLPVGYCSPANSALRVRTVGEVFASLCQLVMDEV
jgi:hypothetical protein